MVIMATVEMSGEIGFTPGEFAMQVPFDKVSICRNSLFHLDSQEAIYLKVGGCTDSPAKSISQKL